jgi:hypothetical protein
MELQAPVYDFSTQWRFDDTEINEVADILEDTASLPRWWPELFQAVTIVRPGAEHALGQVADCRCKARLPYTLHFTYVVVEVRYPYGSTISSTGDLVGQGVWTLRSRARGVDVTYDWRVELRKPLLRLVSPVLRPLLAANHTWSMRRGESGLTREIARRRGEKAPAG